MNKGFTLVELMVALGVFGIIMLSGSNFVIQTLRNSKQAAIQSEVRQNSSIILQDIITQDRRDYCVHYESVSNTALLRFSDDPNGTKCASGSQTEYYQDQNGVITRVATDSAGTQLSFGILSSRNLAVLNCSSRGLACGQSNPALCLPGLLSTSNGGQTTVSIYSQQSPGQSSSENCAAVKLSNTVTPRIK
mgnify:CR=1 FL=1